MTVTFDFTLPSFIVQANITAVYQSSNSVSSGNTHYNLGGLTCTPGTHYADPQVGGAPYVWGQQPYTASWGSVPTVNSVTCSATGAGSVGGTLGQTSYSQVGLYIYYTGTAPPGSNAIPVNPPLAYSPGFGLSLSLPYSVGWDFTNTNSYVVTIPALSSPTSVYSTGQSITLMATNGSTSTTPTVQVNGITATVQKCGGNALASGDIVANLPAMMTYDRSVPEPHQSRIGMWRRFGEQLPYRRGLWRRFPRLDVQRRGSSDLRLSHAGCGWPCGYH